MADAILVNQLSSALKCVQELRIKVSDVLQRLANGINDAEKQTFLAELQVATDSITKDLSDLEKISMSINVSGPILGNVSILSIEPSTDRSPLYQQLIQGYRWVDKVRDRATVAADILKRKKPYLSTMTYKRPARTLVKLPAPAHPIESVIPQFQRMFPELTINYMPTATNNPIIMITVEKAMQAFLVMRGSIIECINLKAIGESSASDLSNKELWKISRHKLFQKLTEQAQATAMSYQKSNPSSPVSTLHSFVVWLRCYTNLFSASCQRCGKHLQNNMPPTNRIVSSNKALVVALHESCQS